MTLHAASLGDRGPPPVFFASVAYKGLRDLVCPLKPSFAGWPASIDSKGDAGTERTTQNGSIGEPARVGFNAECTEFTEKDGIPHPGCFL